MIISKEQWEFIGKSAGWLGGEKKFAGVLTNTKRLAQMGGGVVDGGADLAKKEYYQYLEGLNPNFDIGDELSEEQARLLNEKIRELKLKNPKLNVYDLHFPMGTPTGEGRESKWVLSKAKSRVIKVSKSKWREAGNKAGWLKKASIGKFGPDTTDVLEGMVMTNKGVSDVDLLTKVKNDPFFVGEIAGSNITDQEILSYIRDIKKIYRV